MLINRKKDADETKNAEKSDEKRNFRNFKVTKILLVLLRQQLAVLYLGEVVYGEAEKQNASTRKMQANMKELEKAAEVLIQWNHSNIRYPAGGKNTAKEMRVLSTFLWGYQLKILC